MTKDEQIQLAESFNLSTKSVSELINQFQTDIEKKFHVGKHSQQSCEEYMLNLAEQEYDKEYDRLIKYSKLSKEEAEERAMDYAEALYSQMTKNSKTFLTYMIWTIEEDIVKCFRNIVKQTNEQCSSSIELVVFDACSSLSAYKSYIAKIEESSMPTVLLIKNFTMADAQLFNWLRYDVRNSSCKPYYTVISAPLVPQGDFQERWDAGIGIPQTVLISE